MVATGSRRSTSQRSGMAFAALLVASVAIHGHRIAAITPGASANSGATADVQAAHPAQLALASIGSNVIHHYPG